MQAGKEDVYTHPELRERLKEEIKASARTEAPPSGRSASPSGEEEAQGQARAVRREHGGRKGELGALSDDELREDALLRERAQNRETLIKHLERRLEDVPWFYRESVLKTALSS